MDSASTRTRTNTKFLGTCFLWSFYLYSPTLIYRESITLPLVFSFTSFLTNANLLYFLNSQVCLQARLGPAFCHEVDEAKSKVLQTAGILDELHGSDVGVA